MSLSGHVALKLLCKHSRKACVRDTRFVHTSVTRQLSRVAGLCAKRVVGAADLDGEDTDKSYWELRLFFCSVVLRSILNKRFQLLAAV